MTGKPFVPPCLILLATAALWLAPGTLWASGCTAESAGIPASSEEETAGTGQTVFVDPATGKLIDRPEPEPVPGKPGTADRVQDASSTEPEVPMVELPDGTVRADIGDRFVTELRVEIVDGQVVTCHRPVSPGAERIEPTGKEPDATDDLEER